MGHRDRRVCARDAALGQPLATRPETAAQAEREHDDDAQTARTAGAGLPRAELLVRRKPMARPRLMLSCGKRKTMLPKLMLHHAPNGDWAADLGTRDIQALRGRSFLLPSNTPPLWVDMRGCIQHVPKHQAISTCSHISRDVFLLLRAGVSNSYKLDDIAVTH